MMFQVAWVFQLEPRCLNIQKYLKSGIVQQHKVNQLNLVGRVASPVRLYYTQVAASRGGARRCPKEPVKGRQTEIAPLQMEPIPDLELYR